MREKNITDVIELFNFRYCLQVSRLIFRMRHCILVFGLLLIILNSCGSKHGNPAANKCPGDVIIVLDTVVYGKRVKAEYHTDCNFKDYKTHSRQYPLYVSWGNKTDSFAGWNFDSTSTIDTEEYVAAIKEKSNYFISLHPIDVIKDNLHSSTTAVVVDSSIFIELQCGVPCFYLLRINYNSDTLIVKKVLVSTSHFIIIPQDNVLGCTLSRLEHEKQTLLLKFDKSDYYESDHYLDFAGYRGDAFTGFVNLYNKAGRCDFKVFPISSVRNRFDRYTFYAFASKK